MRGQLTLNSRSGAGTEMIIQIPRKQPAPSDEVPEAKL